MSTAVIPHPTDARVIVITGASSGIGASLAVAAAANGWRVVAIARRAERLNALVTAIRESGGTAQALSLDITASDAPQRIVETAMRSYGRIDAVVHNAGYATPGKLLEQNDTLLEGQWQLHVAAPLRLSRAALPHVRATHGGFVFLGSGLARVPAPLYGAYCAAKAAVRAAAIQLRRELRPERVFSMYVDPGVVDTGFSVASGMAPNEQWWHAKPDDVARKILRGIERRAARVNAVPWQTAGTVVGEWFPLLADLAMASLVERPPTLPPAPVTASLPPAPVSAPEPVPAAPLEVSQPADPFVAALEPVARRMERVKLGVDFVRGLLVADTTIELRDAAMRWAGMPNKNERAAMHEVLTALAEAGYLQAEGPEQWRVLRTPD